MTKINSALGVFMLAILLFAGSVNAQLRLSGNQTDNQNYTEPVNFLPNSVLFNQMDSVGGTGSASQQFPDFSNNVIETAEDFIVPAGVSWRIDSIDVGGQWSVAGPMVTIRYNIYADSGNAGIRPGALLFADSMIVPITALTNASPTFRLPTSRTLTGGASGTKYWISVMTVHPFSTSGQWFWSTRQTRFAPCVLRDPGNLLAGGTAWRITTTAPNQGVQIRLRGEVLTPPAPGPQTTICRSVNVPLPDHSWARDSVQVLLGSGCVITDVNVRIDTVIHTWDADLSFYLNKGAVSSLIIDNVGGSGDNFIGTVLNDSASTLISAGTAPFTGSFKPSNPLAPFNFGAGLGDGYWRLSISDTATGDTGTLRRWCLVISYSCPVGGIQTIEIPNYYSLSQNYPNPFNPSTSIKFTMPQGDNVKLVIFDILGREVKTLVNEFRNSGTYEVNFDASLLASGVYFYRLEAGEFTDTKRMLLVK
ncbi:MAG TPA: T9SS type A sorting domain-containing protein [Ignavibacteria bacterium]|nr:T9SS type A sorting domain-containing protein [Ignavibacteria bacterium]